MYVIDCIYCSFKHDQQFILIEHLLILTVKVSNH